MEKKIYDPLPYKSPDELAQIERNRQALYCESRVGEKYVYTPNGTRTNVVSASAKDLTITMKNMETESEQVLDYSKFIAMLKSGA